MIKRLFKSKISKYIIIGFLLVLILEVCLAVLSIYRIIPLPEKCHEHNDDVVYCFPIFTPQFFWPHFGKETWYKTFGTPTYPRNK